MIFLNSNSSAESSASRITFSRTRTPVSRMWKLRARIITFSKRRTASFGTFLTTTETAESNSGPIAMLLIVDVFGNYGFVKKSGGQS